MSKRSLCQWVEGICKDGWCKKNGLCTTLAILSKNGSMFPKKKKKTATLFHPKAHPPNGGSERWFSFCRYVHENSWFIAKQLFAETLKHVSQDENQVRILDSIYKT